MYSTLSYPQKHSWKFSETPSYNPSLHLWKSVFWSVPFTRKLLPQIHIQHSKFLLRGLKTFHPWVELVSLECSSTACWKPPCRGSQPTAVAGGRENSLTYFACLFSSSRFRLATYPSRYFWSSSNVPTVWLNVLNKIKLKDVLLWRYQGSFNTFCSMSLFLRLHVCVAVIASSVITLELSIHSLLGQGLTLAWSLPIRPGWLARKPRRYDSLSTSPLLFFYYHIVISHVSSQFQNKKGNNYILSL